MGFSTAEIDKLQIKLVAGVIDAASSSEWSDSKLANIPLIYNTNVLTEFSLVPAASTKTAAIANAVANPTIIADLSDVSAAIRLTAVKGSPNTFVVSSSYGVFGNAVRLRNWIHPTRVPLASGLPSIGYAVRVFQGNPASGGVEVLTTTGLTGSGVSATPAWIFNYDQGILLVSDDFKLNLTNPYILGFRYIGKTLADTLAGLGVSNTGSAYQIEIDKIEASTGLAADGSFQSYTDTTYLNTVTSLYEGLKALDTAISSIPAGANLAVVATTGSYTDLRNKPLLFSGSYRDLTDTPAIPATQVQTDWNATNGLGVLLNKPALFSGNYTDLTNRPTLFSGDYTDLTNLPAFSNVAFSGSYSDLTGKPVIPVIPTVVSAFTNDSGYLKAADIAGKADTTYVDTQIANVQTQISNLIIAEAGDITQAQIDAAIAVEAAARQAADAAILAQIQSSTAVALEGIFITGVTATSTGIVGSQTYAPNTVPANRVVLTCASDTANVKITVGVDGSSKSYSPTVTINGVNATVTETSTLRWFTAVADITIPAGTSTITVLSNTGATTSCDITLAGAGPNILSANLGTYPNSQTALKAGDIINVTILTEASAVSVSLLASGAASSTATFAVTNGQVICPVTIGSGTGSQVLTFKAKNSFGTFGTNYTTVNLILDQVAPTFGALTVTYPAGQGALTTGDSATVNCTVTGASSVAYAATGLTVATPTTYAVGKSVSLTSTGYVDSGTNYTITATKASNGTTATKTGLVNIATTSPTAAITTSPAGRMVGSPTGINYTVTVTSTQNLSAAPSLIASSGAYSGNWGGSGKVWTRLLTISDTTAKGAAFFSALAITNQALVAGSTISAGSNYTVGGFSSRTLTFPAFSRVVAVGTSVVDPTKTTCQIVGGNILTLYTDNTVRANGYYIANSDGTYNASGDYIGLSDSAFAGSNTTGTLQITVSEVSI